MDENKGNENEKYEIIKDLSNDVIALGKAKEKSSFKEVVIEKRLLNKALEILSGISNTEQISIKVFKDHYPILISGIKCSNYREDIGIDKIGILIAPVITVLRDKKTKKPSRL